MFSAADVREIHLEVTSRCNASCPMCPRNVSGGALNPNLPLTELSLADVKAILPEAFVRQLKRLYMCGNYGDAMVARDTLDIFRYLRAANPSMALRLFTNASGRDAAWWSALAKTVDTCVFSVDGLEDTNHLYRKGTDWKKIRAAMDAFLGAGGKAEWHFLVFRHNEHQVEEARALAKRLGFVKFVTKKTERFLKDGRRVDRKEVLDEEGRVLYWLERPLAEQHQNEALGSIEALGSRSSGYDDYLQTTPIDCKALKDRQLYVTAEGLVLPCCWTAKLYDARRPNGQGELWRLLQRSGGKDAVDGRKRSIRDIVAGPLFQAEVPAAWEPGSAARKGLLACARACGALDIMKNQRDATPKKEAAER